MGVARRGDHVAAACRSLDCLDGERTNAARKTCSRARDEPLDRLVERQPFDCLHVRPSAGARARRRAHGPEMHDLVRRRRRRRSCPETRAHKPCAQPLRSTSRRAAASAVSSSLIFPFGNTQWPYFRNCTTAISGSRLLRNTTPPAASMGARALPFGPAFRIPRLNMADTPPALRSVHRPAFGGVRERSQGTNHFPSGLAAIARPQCGVGGPESNLSQELAAFGGIRL